MRWLRTVSKRVVSNRQPTPDETDGPTELRQALVDLNRYINRNAGRLPATAVVKARWITDTLREILETTEIRPLEIQAMLAVSGTVRDYLPTTLRSYLILDEDAQVPPAGQPSLPLLLIEQLDSLLDAASRTLDAVRSQDIDALATQGRFLRTKFSHSDLDI